MLCMAADPANPGTSNLTVALIAFGGVLAGALLGYLGKSRELRLLTLTALRGLYAEYMSSRESYFYALDQYQRARAIQTAFWEVELGAPEDEAYESLNSSERKNLSRLTEKRQSALVVAQAERRRYVLSLRQIQIQAPNDTYIAANLSSGLRTRLFRDDTEDVPTDAFDMFVRLARRDLAPYRLMWIVRDHEADRAKRAEWWKEAVGD